LYTDRGDIPAGHRVCVIWIVGEHEYTSGFSSGGENDPCPQGSDYFYIVSCPCNAPCSPPSEDCQFPGFRQAELGDCDCPTLGQQKVSNFNSSRGRFRYQCMVCACL
jgi:hypothetical protein